MSSLRFSVPQWRFFNKFRKYSRKSRRLQKYLLYINMSKGVQANYKHATMTSILRKIFKELKPVHLNEKEQRVAVGEIPFHRKLVCNKFYQRRIRVHLPISRKKGEKNAIRFYVLPVSIYPFLPLHSHFQIL